MGRKRCYNCKFKLYDQNRYPCEICYKIPDMWEAAEEDDV